MEEILTGGLEGLSLSFTIHGVESHSFGSSSKVVKMSVNFALVSFPANTNFLAGIHLLGFLQAFY